MSEAIAIAFEPEEVAALIECVRLVADSIGELTVEDEMVLEKLQAALPAQP